MTDVATIRDRIRADLLPAMREREESRVRALRSALGAIDNAEATPTTAQAGAIEDASVGVGSTEAARQELSAADLRRVLQAEVDERETAAAECATSAPDWAQRLRDEAAVIASYVPD